MKVNHSWLTISLRLTLLFVFTMTAAGVGSLPAAAQTPPEQPGASDFVEIAQQLGIPRPVGLSPTEYSLQIARQVQETGQLPTSQAPASPNTPSANIPLNFPGSAPFSAGVFTAVGGPDGDFAEVDFLADVDGLEDYVADHGAKVDDLSSRIPVTNTWMLTRVAASAHTIANGFTENVFYYGDSVGNLYVAATSATNSPYVTPASAPTAVLPINLPTVLNAFGTLNSDDQIVITGIAVSPVSDLTSFANVNGSFSSYSGKIGEIVYVTFWDTGSGLRLSSGNTLVHSGLLAFPVADDVSPAAAPPGIVSDTGFPVTVGGSFGVAYSTFSNLAGVAVDGDGSIYFQNVDLAQFSGANIVKVTDIGSNYDRSAATSGILTINSLNPLNGVYGTSSGPSTQVNLFTNYSGTSETFGNVAALAAGSHNTLYAAVSRSYNPADGPDVQATEGFFENPAALGPTPDMLISFADAYGAFDPCSSYPYTYTVVVSPDVTQTYRYTGTIPIGNNIADVAVGSGAPTPGVDNFRLFALGSGPDIRSDLSPLSATITNTQKLEFQVDYSIFSGLAVDENDTAYLVSGGTPAGVGRNPSPLLGEILAFPDRAKYDRRADYIDLRSDVTPVPPSSANDGDGVSDRYDHIFWTAPLDGRTATPAGFAGLSRGFLLYLNRTRNGSSFSYLPNGSPQGDNATTSGAVVFANFDTTEVVAGGDDGTSPIRGDNANSGFEYTVIGGPTYTAMYLNSNGNVTFDVGDASGTPSVSSFLSTEARVAPAWADLNPDARSTSTVNFPVQALGFSAANSFKVVWSDVTTAGQEACGSRNSFSLTLYDDGTGVDESASPTPEGPPYDTFAGVEMPQQWRADGSGWVYLDYGRMDLLGTAAAPVLAGVTSGGGVTDASPDGIIDIVPASNLSELGRTVYHSSTPFPAIMTAPFTSSYEFFDTGTEASLANPGPDQVFTPAVPSYDLRFAGNDPAAATPVGQPNLNWDVLSFIEGLAYFFPLAFGQ